MSEVLPEGLCPVASFLVNDQVCAVYAATLSPCKNNEFPWRKIVEDLLAGQGLVAAAAALGRGRIFFLDAEPLSLPLVVRQYRHGGLWRFLTGGRFFSKRRFLNELAVHQAVSTLGIATPAALAVIVVKKRASLFVNGYYVTRRLSAVVELPEFLRGANASIRLQVAFKLGGYLRKLHEHGIFYTDMHVKNILVGAEGQIFLLDFDKADQSGAPLAARRCRANLCRFFRSVDKYCSRGGKFTDTERAAFLLAYEPDAAAYARLRRELTVAFFWRRIFHQFGWWLNRS
ncbi:MAG: hypothetical protein JXR80_11985 [Deltaproteobacteria bacterium]|nr:hypothetical protein [Deltaproteobacteria bacterium]